MTIAVIATQNADRTVSAILMPVGGEPKTLGEFLLSHYTRRGQVRRLVRLGHRTDNLPHPDYLLRSERGPRARRGLWADVIEWADRENAQFTYLMGFDGRWHWQRLGPTRHGVALQPLTLGAIKAFYEGTSA